MLIRTFLRTGSKFQPQGKSETRRKDPRLFLPCHCRIGLDQFEIDNISLGGFRIKNATPFLRRRVTAKIIFPFGSTAFRTALPAEQIYYDLHHDFAGYRFIDIEETGISLIRGIIANHLAGFPFSNQTKNAAENKKWIKSYP